MGDKINTTFHGANSELLIFYCVDSNYKKNRERSYVEKDQVARALLVLALASTVVQNSLALACCFMAFVFSELFHSFQS